MIYDLSISEGRIICSVLSIQDCCAEEPLVAYLFEVL